MAHRQLAEKYAAQLNDANKRALELESTIADLEDRLAQTNSGAQTSTTNASEEVLNSLRNQLVNARRTIGSLSVERKTADAKAIPLQVQLEMLKKQPLGSRGQLPGIGRASPSVAEDSDTIALARPWATNGGPAPRSKKGKTSSTQLEDALKSSTAATTEVETLKKDLRTSRLTIRALKSHSTRFKNQAEEANQLVIRYKKENDDLKAELSWEEKRRVEVENMLGPEGKRCRKCDPVVVDLSDGL